MGVSKSAISRVTGVEVTPKNFNTGKAAMLPQRLVIIGQGNDDVVYTLDKFECTGSAADVAARYGYGSPLHLAAKQLFPSSGAMATFPVSIIPVQKTETSTPAFGQVLITGEGASANGSCMIYIGGVGVELVVTKGTNAQDAMNALVAEVNKVLDRPAGAVFTPAETVDGAEIPAHVTLTSRWSGALSNRISLVMEGEIPGLSFALTSFTGGAGTPAVDDALASIGEIWETFILNTFDYKDGDSPSRLLDTYQSWGEGRWSVLEKKPCLVCHGCTDDYPTRTAITDLRPTDYINFLAVSTGSRELPFVVGAKWLFDILTTADSNPAQNYKGLLTGLSRGSDAVQENYTTRNMSVSKGSSTNIVNGSVAEINDTVTFYHPAGEGKYPSRRYVVDAVKVMNIVYNLRLITEADNVKGAPLVPDFQVTSNPSALQPKTFRTWFINLANSLGLNAIISDVEFTVKNLVVSIDSENPKRVNYTFPCKVSGNVEVVSGDLYFGQYVA